MERRPAQQVRAVLERGYAGKNEEDEVDEADGQPHRQLRTVQWGLVPAWSRDVKIGANFLHYANRDPLLP